MKPGEVFQPVRVAISGTTVSAGIFESVALLGREESLRAHRRRSGRAHAPRASVPPTQPLRRRLPIADVRPSSARRKRG